MTKRILEIGPGTITGKSAIFLSADTVDGKVGQPTAAVLWGEKPLPFDDNTYDLVFASHVLEHVPWYRTIDALKEAYRVLKPGGELEVYVPDFEYIVRCYLERRCGDSWRVFNPNSDYRVWVNGRIFTYGEDAVELLSPERPIPQTHHKAVFDSTYLADCFVRAGFEQHRKVPNGKRRYGQCHSVPEAGVIGIKT